VNDLDAGPVYTSSAIKGDVTALKFNHNGDTLFSAGQGVLRWTPSLKIKKGTSDTGEVPQIDDPRINDLAVAVANDGKERVFALGNAGKLYSIDVDTWTARAIGVCGPSSFSLAASSRYVLVVGTSCIKVFDPSRGAETKEFFNASSVAFPHNFTPYALAGVSANNETFVVGGGTPGSGGLGQLYVWDPQHGSGGPLSCNANHEVRSVSLSPDGTLVAADTDGQVTLWSIANP
jgi:WD40 repeat protein